MGVSSPSEVPLGPSSRDTRGGSRYQGQKSKAREGVRGENLGRMSRASSFLQHRRSRGVCPLRARGFGSEGGQVAFQLPGADLGVVLAPLVAFDPQEGVGDRAEAAADDVV